MKRYIARRFDAMSAWIAYHLGTPNAFMLACLLVFVWAVTGPYFEYSDTWQLVINTGTTIATFLMVFLLQNTGNRTIDEMHERLKKLETQNKKLIELIEQQMNNNVVTPRKRLIAIHNRHTAQQRDNLTQP